MAFKGSRIEIVYSVIKAELLSGRFFPGQRIDVSSLADSCNVSKTPVRMVLNRLVGEEIVSATPHEGFSIPRLTEQKLRDLYSFTQAILLLSLETQPLDPQEDLPVQTACLDDVDTVSCTEQLFCDVTSLTGNAEFKRAIARTNDRLRPIRRLPKPNPTDARLEVLNLKRAWNEGDREALRDQILAYHRLRFTYIPQQITQAYRDQGVERGAGTGQKP